MPSLFFRLYNSWTFLQGINLLEDSVAWEKARSHVTCAVTSQVCTCLFKMAHSSEISYSVDSSYELSELEDVEVLNNAAVEIVHWRFEPRDRPRDERLHFEREDEERVDRNDRRRNTDW